ncbi:MAG: hypothetical protein JNL23_00605 [Chitinophagaceae bacterium]|nr:hypothetical protein [Chitinophagaceae bacterium]
MKYLLLVLICISGNSIFAQQKDSTHKEFLAVLTLSEKYKDEKNWTQADQAIVGEHFQRLIKYKNEGTVVLAGRTDYETNNPDMMGLVIFYAKDLKEARQFMMDDPAVKNKIMLVKVHPYGIALNKCQ